MVVLQCILPYSGLEIESCRNSEQKATNRTSGFWEISVQVTFELGLQEMKWVVSLRRGEDRSVKAKCMASLIREGAEV